MVLPPKFLETLGKLSAKDRQRKEADKRLRDEMRDFFGSYRSEGLDMAAAKAAAPTQSAALYAKHLAAMKAKYDGQKEAAKKGGNDVPNGTYLCRFNRGELRTFNMKDENGKPTTVFGAQLFFKVTDGEQAGESIPKWPKFDTDQGVMWFWRDLQKLGVDIDNYTSDQWPQILADLTKTKPGVRIQVEWGTSSSGNPYQNVYLRQAVAVDELGSAAVATGGSPAVEIEEPEPEGEPEPAPAPAVVKPAAKKAAPAAAAGGSKPPTKKAVAAPAPAPDPDEPEPEGEPEPEPEPEGEPEPAGEEPTPDESPIEPGDPVQFKSKGISKRGLVKAIEDDGTVFVREDGTTQNWKFKSVTMLTKIV